MGNKNMFGRFVSSSRGLFSVHQRAFTSRSVGSLKSWNTHGWTKVAAIGASAVGAFALYSYFNSSYSLEKTSDREPYVYKIVLTGGPCGGKSTALSNLSQRLVSLGYEVFLVPEVATMLITGGVSFAGRTREDWIQLQISLMRLQRSIEDEFERIAKLGSKDAVILCDRGLCDNRAYLAKEDFDMLLDTEGLKLVDVRDKRYDAVFHLVTAAIGAEKFYTTANNTARSETVEQARELDYRVLDGWIGHPNLRVVDNSTSFDGKIKRVVDGICKAIGAIPSAPERKYLVDSVSIPSNLTVELFDVQTVFIKSQDGAQVRAIRRSQGGNSTYMVSSSAVAIDGESVVESRQISPREFMALQAGSTGGTIVKKISYFIWNGRYYALNEYVDEGFTTLEVEALPSESTEQVVPPFVRVSKDVTNDNHYSTGGIAANLQ